MSMSSVGPKKWNWNWDGHHEYFLDAVRSNYEPNGKRIITLIRHSQYNNNSQNKILTELGQKQALITGQRLNDIGTKFDKIYCSHLTRAKQSAEIIVNELIKNNLNEIIYDSDLNEGLATNIEPFTSYFTIFTKQQFMEHVFHNSQRIKKGYKKYFHRRNQSDMTSNNKKVENILIIGHENTIRYYLTKIMQFNDAGWCRYGLLNCSISRVEIMDDGTVKCTAIGDAGHLPSELLTNNLIKANL